MLFGPDHWAVLTLTAAAAVTAVALARRSRERPAGRALRAGLALFLLAGTVGYVVAELRAGRLTAWDLAPLHLCDFAIFVAVFALLTLDRLACELVYFWAGSGTLLAMVTPDVWLGFPDWRFLLFFGMHGGVLVSALTLTFGFGATPRPGAVRRVFLFTLAYAAIVAAVDFSFDKNFLFLRGKPQTRTLLDALGPWPVYLVAAGALGLALFVLLNLPFRRLKPHPNVC